MSAAQRVRVTQLAETPLDALAQGYVALTREPAPDESTLAPHEVLVRVKSAAVGWVDLLMLSGQYQHMPELPYTPGLEYAGEVCAAGSLAAREFERGARVLADGSKVGPRSRGAYQSQGGFATYAVLPADALVRVPEALSLEQASVLLGGYETAYYALVTRGRVAAGETVLVHGASGATGLAAVQMATALGARVLATGRSAEKLAQVRLHGALATFVLADERPSEGDGSLRDFCREHTQGRGVDLVYDTVGGPLSVESLRCVRFGARVLIVGWAGTPFVARGRGQRGAPNANMLPTNLVMMKGLDVLGCPMVIGTMVDPSLRAPRLAALLRGVEDGWLRPHISHRFALDEFDRALRARWSGAVLGGCVVLP